MRSSGNQTYTTVKKETICNPNIAQHLQSQKYSECLYEIPKMKIRKQHSTEVNRLFYTKQFVYELFVNQKLRL